MADVSDAIKKANPTLFSLPTEADKARNTKYGLDPRYVKQTDYGKVQGKEVVDVGVYKHPVLGYTYEYDIYSDGTNALSEFFKSIGGEEKIKEYVPKVGYLDLNKPGFRLLTISRLLDEGGGGDDPRYFSGSNASMPIAGSSTGKTYTAPDGKIFTDLNAYNAYIDKTAADEKARKGQSAYDLLFSEFDRYGMGALVDPLKGFIQDGLSEAEFTLRLRETDAYKKRFAANAQRINKGLRALSEAEYILEEDKYQDVMRRYGLPESYYARGDMGRQEGFEKLIAGDVSPVELEDRIQTGQRRVLNAAPQIKNALTQYYGDEISNGDILAYVLDPAKAIENIKRKVTAAEIGGGALRAGLGVSRGRAEELGQYGVTGEQAVTGFGTIASGLERGRQLSQIYNQPDYTQAVAEAEVFALPNAEQARRQRRKLGQLETTTFSGTSGVTGGALSRERAGQY
jgi:hypothetical protein